MSESSQIAKTSILDFSREFINTEDSKELILENGENLKSLTPEQVLTIFEEMGITITDEEALLQIINKLSNVFYKPLMERQWHYPEDNYFLQMLVQENRKLEITLLEIKNLVKKYFIQKTNLSAKVVLQLKALLPGLQLYALHHLKIEKILIPNFQKAMPQFGGYCHTMELFHKEYRYVVTQLFKALYTNEPDKQQINVLIGKLSFHVFLMLFREEQVFFPVAVQNIPPGIWDEMLKQSLEASMI